MSRIPTILFLCVLTPVFGQTAVPSSGMPLVPKALPVDETTVSNVNPALQTPVPAPPAKPAESSPAPAPASGKPVGDDALRLQIFLDQSNFGPGVIDGKPGRFTELAVDSWNEVNGHPGGDWVAVNTAARKAVPTPLAVALVPEIIKDWVDPELPQEKTLQAKKKRMSYRSVCEFMAERYHCSEDFLVQMNGARKINKLKERDAVMVPNVEPFLVEKIDGTKHDADPELSARHVVVNTKINQVRIFEAAPVALVVAEPDSTSTKPPARANRGLIASFPITPGQPKFIKFGTWELRGMVELPWWRYDQQLLDTGKRSDNALNIPPGPNSPVGVIWNGTSRPGIGLHGTSDPETIGRARSHGCIRLANWDAIRLPALIRPGATVEIR